MNPIAQGNIINIDVNIENDNLFEATPYSFFAIDSDIEGTSAVEKAVFIASGNVTKVSILERIPAFVIANVSSASFVIPDMHIVYNYLQLQYL